MHLLIIKLSIVSGFILVLNFETVLPDIENTRSTEADVAGMHNTSLARFDNAGYTSCFDFHYSSRLKSSTYWTSRLLVSNNTFSDVHHKFLFHFICCNVPALKMFVIVYLEQRNYC